MFEAGWDFPNYNVGLIWKDALNLSDIGHNTKLLYVFDEAMADDLMDHLMWLFRTAPCVLRPASCALRAVSRLIFKACRHAG